MPRHTPTALADEIRARRGAWSLDGVRLRPPRPRSPYSFPVAIMLGGGVAWSEVTLDRGPRRDVPDAATALKRSGYDILAVDARPFFARRRLWNLREIRAEIRRLEALSDDLEIVYTFPERLPRKRGLPVSARPFSLAAFDALRDVHGWRPEWVSVGRRGPPGFAPTSQWTAGAWCWAHEDGEERLLGLHVQLFRKGPPDAFDSKELTRLAGELEGRLEPLGYTVVKVRGPKPPGLALFDKKLATLARARRERAILDRALFAD